MFASILSCALDGRNLEFPEFYRTSPQHILQYSSVWTDKRFRPGEYNDGRENYWTCLNQAVLENKTLLYFAFFSLSADLYLYDCGVLWASDLLHRHHHQEVLHHPWFCYFVWKRDDRDAVDWHYSGFPR